MTNHVQLEEAAMVVATASSNVNGPWTAVDNPSALGLFVPALASASTVTIQVARDAAGTGGGGLVDKAGTAILVLGSSSGGFAVSSSDLAPLLGYAYMRVVLGTHQGADVTFLLQRKVFASDPYA